MYSKYDISLGCSPVDWLIDILKYYDLTYYDTNNLELILNFLNDYRKFHKENILPNKEICNLYETLNYIRYSEGNNKIEDLQSKMKYFVNLNCLDELNDEDITYIQKLIYNNIKLYPNISRQDISRQNSYNDISVYVKMRKYKNFEL